MIDSRPSRTAKRPVWRRALRTTAVALTVAVAAVTATPQPASATAFTSCTAWGFYGGCWTAVIPASSGHHISYAVGSCGVGFIYDADNGNQVGPTNIIGAGRIYGLYGNYHMFVRNLATFGCTGSIAS